MPLDVSMQPKISDFGLARLFSGSQTQGNTKRIAGLSKCWGLVSVELLSSVTFDTVSIYKM
jgi:hypothetical protein